MPINYLILSFNHEYRSLTARRENRSGASWRTGYDVLYSSDRCLKTSVRQSRAVLMDFDGPFIENAILPFWADISHRSTNTTAALELIYWCSSDSAKQWKVRIEFLMNECTVTARSDRVWFCRRTMVRKPVPYAFFPPVMNLKRDEE